MNNYYKRIKTLVESDYNNLSIIFDDILSIINKENELLGSEIKNYLNGTSKQLRSCLIFLFSNALQIKPNENIIKLAASVEIIHNATLIHDDVIDKSSLRRGLITINKKYSDNLAIITGDFLLSIAIKLLNSINNKNITENFADCLLSLCKGEINQYFSQKTTSTISKYIEKSNTKTASLFIASLKSLSELADATQKNSLINFAKNFGIAFQINDDLNNLLNEDNKKPIHNDIQNGIYTAPVIYAFGENKNLSNYTTDEIIKKSKEEKNIQQTKTLIKKHLNIAIKELENLPQNIYTKSILEICNNIL